jgi:hypothetical protein
MRSCSAPESVHQTQVFSVHLAFLSLSGPALQAGVEALRILHIDVPLSAKRQFQLFAQNMETGKNRGLTTAATSDVELLWSSQTLPPKFTSSTFCSSRLTHPFGGVCTCAVTAASPRCTSCSGESSKCFGFVNRYDTKPKRRLFEMLKSQGMQMNQAVTFLSDGGDTVRDLQLYLNPQAEHLLDWFHISMRLTVMSQLAKSIEADDQPNLSAEIEKDLKRLKWNLWHGNVHKALQIVKDLEYDLDLEENSQEQRKLLKAVREFGIYITANRTFIPNYGDRYRHGETISTAFVESAINQVVSKRMVKKQQMRWTDRGAHLLLQVRTRVLNEEWRSTLSHWYPAMQETCDAKAA